MTQPLGDGSGRIVVDGLRKTYGRKAAVDNLSFTADPGMVTGLLGATGAGKTTTLRMLLGLCRPDAGTATINGVAFAELRHPARVVGASLDSQRFHTQRTARQHLLACAAAIGLPDARVERVLTLVGLAGAAGERTRRFSPGMRRRLALATALLGDPPVLVLDEPARGLEPDGCRWLGSLLRTVAQDGRTVLVTGAQLGPLEQTMDVVTVLRAGAAVFTGPPEALAAGRGSRTLVACADPHALGLALVAHGVTDVARVPDGRLAVAADPRDVARIAVAAGVPVSGMAAETGDLQQTFLTLIGGPPPALPQPPPWTPR